MEDIFVIEHIKELCRQRGWTYYRLALNSGISHSSISSMLNKQHIPSMANLIKICNGFELNLSEFFKGIEQSHGISNAVRDMEINRLWHLLDYNSKRFILGYIYGLTRQNLPDYLQQEENNEI